MAAMNVLNTMQTAESSALPAPLSRRTLAFYRAVMQELQSHDVPFLVGGAYAFASYTGITRDTKDLDIFVRPADHERALTILAQGGYRTELTFPHWLGKVYRAYDCVDIIFSSGNGLATVDEAWFEHAVPAPVLGTIRCLVPPEEMIWSKGFVMERERFDGADIAHLISAQAHRFRWRRLLDRFGEHWRVLLSHLILFGFVYPDERRKVPAWVMGVLLERLADDLRPDQPRTPGLCQGTLISREQYLPDVEAGGYTDARMAPYGPLTPEEIAIWTADIDHEAPQLTNPRPPVSDASRCRR
jgi:hypothetical protein